MLALPAGGRLLGIHGDEKGSNMMCKKWHGNKGIITITGVSEMRKRIRDWNTVIKEHTKKAVKPNA